MLALAAMLIEMGAPGRGAPTAVRWFADWLPDADQREIAAADLDRINRYSGAPQDLHALLAAVLPLPRPRWFEVPITAAGGTEMILGYGAVPASGGIDAGFACYAPTYRRIIGPLGPARVTTTEMRRPDDASDESWREMRTAAGIVLRAILFERRA